MVFILFQIFKFILIISFKKHETLTIILTIHVHINKINHRLVFQKKDGYKPELQTPETKKLFGKIKNK